MYNKTNAYGKVANAETDPLKQIVMLYDGAIKFLNLAAIDIETGDILSKSEHTNRALDIILYLADILDWERGGEVANVLNNLYMSLTAKILKASFSLDAAEMRHAAELLAPVRDSWNTIANDQATPATRSVPQQASITMPAVVAVG
jgi:flagellar secretion chaperone FliS